MAADVSKLTFVSRRRSLGVLAAVATVVALSAGGATFASRSASTPVDPAQPGVAGQATGTAEHAPFSDSEVLTFNEVERMLVSTEAMPGMIAVGGPSGETIGYVRTEDLLAKIAVPMGTVGEPSLALYNSDGASIGEWEPDPTAMSVGSTDPAVGQSAEG